MDKHQNLVMTIFALGHPDGEDDNGFDKDDLPTQTDIDWVEVYNYDQANKEFKLNFRDDFDSYDSGRWNSAHDKTWNDLGSVFKKENA